MQHYNAKSETEALEKWCEKSGLEVSDVPVPDKVEVKPEFSFENIEDDNAPFGYELINGVLQIINDDADVVRNIYERYMSGQTMESISRSLAKNQDGRDDAWNVGIIRDILKNPLYAGYDFKGGDVIKAEHPPIIQKEIFNSVQERIQRNIRNPRYRTKPLILGD